jgi:hypothetical protein
MLDELFYSENRWKLWVITVVLTLLVILSWYAHWTISDYAQERLPFAEDTWKWWVGHFYVRVTLTSLAGATGAILALLDWPRS